MVYMYENVIIKLDKSTKKFLIKNKSTDNINLRNDGWRDRSLQPTLIRYKIRKQDLRSEKKQNSIQLRLANFDLWAKSGPLAPLIVFFFL